MQQNSTEIKTGATELIFLFVAFVSHLVNGVIENYEVLFKLLTIFSLILACGLYVGKYIMMFSKMWREYRKRKGE